MARVPVPGVPAGPHEPEPPPPLGSWTKFYLLVALIHVAVVTTLILFSNAYRYPQLPR
jgi:hypothetical protein